MEIGEEFDKKSRELDSIYLSFKIPGEIRKAALERYNQEKQKLEEEFRASVFSYYGVTDNPKAGKAFQMACEHGHSGGFNEIEVYFSNFIELIK